MKALFLSLTKLFTSFVLQQEQVAYKTKTGKITVQKIVDMEIIVR